MPMYVPFRKVNRNSHFSATACLWEWEQFFRKQLTVQPGGALVMVEGLEFLRQYSDVMFCAFLRLTAGNLICLLEWYSKHGENPDHPWSQNSSYSKQWHYLIFFFVVRSFYYCWKATGGEIVGAIGGTNMYQLPLYSLLLALIIIRRHIFLSEFLQSMKSLSNLCLCMRVFLIFSVIK